MQKINKVVIPIAGYGSRMFPETLLINKAYIPIGNKPSIIHILEEIKAAEVSNVIFIISPAQKDIISNLTVVNNDIESHFENNTEIDDYNTLIKYFNFTYIVQDIAKGLGDAIYHALPAINHEPFGVVLGDNVMTKESPSYGIGELMDAYNQTPGNYIGVIHVSDEETCLYGMVDGENVNNPTVKVFPFTNIVEKPKTNPPSNYACLGRYIFNYSIFDYLDKVRKPETELILPDAIFAQMVNETVYGVKLNGRWLDVGNKLGFIKANIDYALQDDKTREVVLKHLKNTYNIK